MRQSLTFSLLLTAFSLSPLWAQVPSDQKIQQDTDQVRKDYEAKARHDLKVLDHKIHKLKTRTDQKLNADLQKEQAALETQKKATEKQLADLSASTGDAWKDLRAGMDKSLKDLGASVNKALAQFKPTPTP